MVHGTCIAGPIRTIIRCAKTKFQVCMVGHNVKVIRHQAKPDLTFSNVDLTYVRCQTVIIGNQLHLT